MSFRVVGIEASPGEFPPVARQQDVHLSQALDPGRSSAARLAVRLTDGQSGVDAFAAAVQKLAGEQPVLMSPRAPQTASVQRSMRLQALPIWLVASALAP